MKLITLALLMTCLLTLNAHAEPKQNPANGNWYDVVEADGAALNYWDDAERLAMALGGHLVSIQDSAEQTWIFNNIVSGSNRNYLIGLNDVLAEGSLSWSDGDASSYANWRSGYTNTAGKDYAYIRQSDGLWDIGYAKDYRLGIAEIPVATPEPISAALFVLGGAILLRRKCARAQVRK